MCHARLSHKPSQKKFAVQSAGTLASPSLKTGVRVLVIKDCGQSPSCVRLKSWTRCHQVSWCFALVLPHSVLEALSMHFLWPANGHGTHRSYHPRSAHARTEPFSCSLSVLLKLRGPPGIHSLTNYITHVQSNEAHLHHNHRCRSGG